MRNLTIFMAGVFLLLPTLLGCRTHYEVYEVKPLHESAPLFKAWLKGQFDQEEMLTVGVRMSYFANPARKNKESSQKLWHQTWYEIKDAKPEPKRKVAFKNQFGDQTVLLGRARYLIVPAAKQGTNERIPGNSHFKCYEVLQWEGGQREVRLEDQFHKDAHSAVVGKCVLFCVPVTKRLADKEPEKIGSETWHLAIYEIKAEVDAHKAVVRDQFHEKPTDLVMRGPVYLSVPSDKLDWTRIDG